MAEYKKVKCPRCGGKGFSLGDIKLVPEGESGPVFHPTFEKCQTCNGSGQILRDIEDIEREEAREAMRRKDNYWDRISEMNDRQEAKGMSKYGQPLEGNTDMPNVQRIEHAQEEAIDLLKYLEHLKQTVVDGITANDYQRAAMRTASGMNYDNHGMLMNGVLGLCGETGEAADIVKKATFQGHELDKEHIAEELGDVSWYLAVAAHAIGYDLGDIFQMNIDKLAKRYPEGFSKERSLNREGK